MIGRRGFQIVEPLRVSSGSARVQAPLTSKNNSPLAPGNRTQFRVAVPRHARAPPNR
jgi:hypothetical protein